MDLTTNSRKRGRWAVGKGLGTYLGVAEVEEDAVALEDSLTTKEEALIGVDPLERELARDADGVEVKEGTGGGSMEEMRRGTDEAEAEA